MDACFLVLLRSAMDDSEKEEMSDEPGHGNG